MLMKSDAVVVQGIVTIFPHGPSDIPKLMKKTRHPKGRGAAGVD